MEVMNRECSDEREGNIDYEAPPLRIYYRSVVLLYDE